MSEKVVDLFDPNFEVDFLTKKNPSHQIKSLKPMDKNVELRVIVLSKKDNFMTKNHVSFTSFVVADSTGSISANFYTNKGDCMSPGDILYINGAYTSLFKGQLILYEGKTGIILKIGEFYFNFAEEPNISTLDWSEFNKKDNEKD